MNKILIALAPMVLVAGCGETANEAAADRVEDAAEANAAAAGPAPVALGLSEAQLLDANLVGANNVELGDVNSLVRGPSGAVEALVVEVEDSNPERHVRVPISGLTVVTRGTDTDLSTTMTKEQVAALPEATLPVQ
ncbi:MAG: PRC-barrel domain containing protein [Sphingomonas sp.]